MNFAVIIPSYNPDDKLLSVIKGLENLGVTDIIVVNDGSKKQCNKYFDEVKKLECVTLLSHEKNMGKGAALKTAFRYFLDNCKQMDGCVTADGDAQHTPEDIVACALEMCSEKPKVVLGVRDFSLPHIPGRSRFGNKCTSIVFRIFVGMKVSDTQTGLRAIPIKYMKDMIDIPGNRYEYETNMLLEMKRRRIPFCEKVIETVYIEENKTSHFKPVRDSIRIYSIILANFFKYSLSSLLCLAAEQAIQTGIFSLAIGALGKLTELVAFVPARIISSIFNFILNKHYVFKDKSQSKSTIIKYYVLWFFQSIVTMGLEYLVAFLLFNTSSTITYTITSLVIKTLIAIVSFRVQKDWVFAEKIKNNDGKETK